MFFNTIKNFLIKNQIGKLSYNTPAFQPERTIKTVGVIFDGNCNVTIDAIFVELIKHGIQEKDINILIFKNKIKKNEIINFGIFTYNDIDWSGEITNSNANLFLNKNFDLLINYHDFGKLPLVYASYLSKANFKVGFTSGDKIVNHFMINTSLNNYQLYIEELFKYLKILNKI